MTVDPFKNHFRNIRLLRISEENLSDSCTDERKYFILVEGRIKSIKVHEGLFTELLVQDDLASLKISVITYDAEAYKINEKIVCIGFMQFNWLPDYRCTALEPYKSAMRAEIIKRR